MNKSKQTIKAAGVDCHGRAALVLAMTAALVMAVSLAFAEGSNGETATTPENGGSGTTWTDAEIAAGWSRYDESVYDWHDHYLTNSVTGWALSLKGYQSTVINGFTNPLGLTDLDLSTLDGVQCDYKVTEIGEKVFLRNTTLQSVKFPKTLETIGMSAFECWSSDNHKFLINLNGASLVNIKSKGFYACKFEQDHVAFTNALSVLSIPMEGPVRATAFTFSRESL